jgi:hypothetical protein
LQQSASQWPYDYSARKQPGAASLQQLLQQACGDAIRKLGIICTVELSFMSLCRVLQGQEATAALLTQSRQYFSLTADFSEDVGGAAKVGAAHTAMCPAGTW